MADCKSVALNGEKVRFLHARFYLLRGCGGMADAMVLEAMAERRRGSTPLIRTFF